MSVQKNIILQRFVEMSSAESELGLAKQLKLAKFQVLLLSAFDLVDVPLNLYISTAMQAEWGNKW